jgi:glutathione S-transferase
MLTLYTAHGACSTSVHFMLEELGIPYDIKTVALKDGAQNTPEYKAINPRSKVPALDIGDGEILTEAGSIIQYVCDKYAPGQYLGALGSPERARATQWMAYIASGVHPNWTRHVRSERFGDEAAKPSIDAKAVEMWQTEWDFVEAELAKRGPFTCGAKVQASDFYLYTLARWGRTVTPSTLDRPHVKKFFDAMTAMPSVQRVLKATGLS